MGVLRTCSARCRGGARAAASWPSPAGRWRPPRPGPPPTPYSSTWADRPSPSRPGALLCYRLMLFMFSVPVLSKVVWNIYWQINVWWNHETVIRGCPYITSAAISRQGHLECLQMLTEGSKGSFKSLCLMKIQSNPHFVWHQKCEISIKIPLLRAKVCKISTSFPNLLNQNKVYWKKISFRVVHILCHQCVCTKG